MLRGRGPRAAAFTCGPRGPGHAPSLRVQALPWSREARLEAVGRFPVLQTRKLRLREVGWLRIGPGLNPEPTARQGRPEPRCGGDAAQCSEQALLGTVRGILPGVVITPALSGELSAATRRQVPRPKASDVHTERFPGWRSRVSPARRLSSFDASVPGCLVRFCIFTYPALWPGAPLGAFVVLGHRSPACVGRGGGVSQPAQGEAAPAGQLSLHLCCSLHLRSVLRGAMASVSHTS